MHGVVEEAQSVSEKKSLFCRWTFFACDPGTQSLSAHAGVKVFKFSYMYIYRWTLFIV